MTRRIIYLIVVMMLVTKCKQKVPGNDTEILPLKTDANQIEEKKSSIILLIQNDIDSIKESEIMFDTLLKQKEGLAKLYYKNGKLKQEGLWHKDKQEGIWKFFNNDGSINSEITFANDNQNGLSVFYNRSGVVIERTNWKNGKLDGISIEYYDDSKVKRLTKWIDGKKIEEKKYPSVY